MKELQHNLNSNGFLITKEIQSADIIIFAECAASDSFIEKAQNTINDIYNKFQNKKIIITGCVSTILAKEKSIPKQCIVLPDNQKIYTELGIHKISAANIDNLYQDKNKKNSNRGFLSIGEGCSNNCSYCNIKLAKPIIKSKPISEIISSLELLAGAGKNNILLIADDCGSYGLDINTSFPELLDTIMETNKRIKISLWNFFPGWFIKQYPLFKKHIEAGRLSDIDLPVQSGSEKILQLMNRPYDLLKLLEIIKEIRDTTKIYLRAQFIFNFPTETIHDFYKSLDIATNYDYVVLMIT